MTDSDRAASEEWWSTGIIEMEPGMIRYLGYAVEELIGRLSFPAMIWLMLRGERPSDGGGRSRPASALHRHRPRLGAAPAGRPQQGPDPPRPHLALHGTGTAVIG